MGRVLAIDFGSKRVGLAVTDSLQIIATGLTTVHSKDVINYLKEYFKKEKVDCVVIGEPKKLDNTPSDIAVQVEAFVKNFKKNFPDVKVERVDERFTSKMAFQTMIDSGLRKKARQNKALVDEISATIILQSYLESRR
ncbi:MAG: Holliday junction resolvase RuvX [Bacteroidetes bacterium]|nr:Holliday junction resolvase RuvX [Bacteroidota bacterium]HET6243088.1 Holliday junction resolvase RuvX [Bacteroidia bacterium]